MAPSLFTGCFDSGSSTGSALSARRLARESRLRPWLANSILARKSTVHSVEGSCPHVGDAPTAHEEKSSGSESPASPAGNVVLVPSSSEESLLAEKASDVAGAVVAARKSGRFGALWARANSLARIPSRIPRLQKRSASEEAITPSHAAALSEGLAALSLGSESPSQSSAGATCGMSSSGWVRRIVAAVSSRERKLMQKTTGNSEARPAASSQVLVRSRPASAVRRAGSYMRRDLAHKVSLPLLFGKVSSALRGGASSGRQTPKKSILKVKDPTKDKSVEESRVRSLLGRAQAKQRPRVHFDGYPITFVVSIDGPDSYDRSSVPCWSCNLNAETEGGHDEDCVSFDHDPYVESPSRAAWESSQRQLRDARDEALAMASGGAIRC